MIYGDIIIHKFNDYLPKVDEQGETIIKNGEIVVEKKEKTIKLRFTPDTFIHYKNITKNELLLDFMGLDKKNNNVEKTAKEMREYVDELSNKKTEDLTDEEINKVYEKINLVEKESKSIKDFMRNLCLAMVMTYEGENARGKEEILIEDLQNDNLYNDDNFIKEITALLTFNVKKKYGLFGQTKTKRK